MDERTDERIDHLIALAALGELSEVDEAELDTLLADDVELSNELDGALDAAAALHASIPEAPPPQLRASVLDAVASTPQTPATPSLVDDPTQFPIAEKPAATPAIDLSERRRRRNWSRALSAVAAVVLLAGVGIVFVRGDSDSDVDRRAAVETVVGADDAVTETLEGELTGTLTVVYSAGEDALVIDGDGLPVLGEDRAFVLWFVSDDGAMPVEIFRPDESGDVLVRVDGVDPTDVVLGITEEDADGAATPTEPILAST